MNLSMGLPEPQRLKTRKGTPPEQVVADAEARRAQCRDLMLQGLSVKQIARLMGVASRRTVAGYVAAILHDEGVTTRLELLAREIERLRGQERLVQWRAA